MHAFEKKPELTSMHVSTGAKVMILYISKHASAVSFWVLQYLRALNVMLWISELAFKLNY